MPVQRIPRYILLLRELYKYTAAEHPDYRLIDQAKEKIQNMMDELNREIDQDAAAKMQKIISIEDSIEDLALPEGLYHPKREFVREGLLVLKVTQTSALSSDGEGSARGLRAFQKQFYVFLFSDLIVCCGRITAPASPGVSKVEGKTDGKETKNKQFLYASSLGLKDVVSLADGPDQTVSSPSKIIMPFVFHLKTPLETWLITAKSEEEKTSWMKDIEKYRSGTA